MTTVFGVNATKRSNSSPKIKIDSNEDGSRVRCSFDQYTVGTTNDLAAGDIIKAMKMPKGAKVINVHIRTDGSLAGSSTLSVGYSANGADSANPNAFIDALDTSSAAVSKWYLGDADQAQDGDEPLGYEFKEEGDIEIEGDVASSVAGDVIISLYVFWTRD